MGGLVVPLLYSSSQEGEFCAYSTDALAQVWNDNVRATVRQVLGPETSSPVPNAARIVERKIFNYVDTWKSLHRKSCLAHAARVESDRLFDLRLACLARRKQELGGLLAALTASPTDGQSVDTVELGVQAIRAASDLIPIDLCDVPAERLVRDPQIPEKISLRPVAAKIQRMLAQSRASRRLGHLHRATSLAKSAAELSSDDDLRALQAAATLQTQLVKLANHVPLDPGALEQAIHYAAGKKDYTTVSRALLALAKYGLRAQKLDESTAFLHGAYPAITAAGTDASDLSEYYNIRALLHRYRGELDKAGDDYQSALELLQDKRGDRYAIDLATTLSSYGLLVRKQGDFSGAKKLQERARVVVEQVYGPMHPSIAFHHINLAGTSSLTGKYQECIDQANRAVEILSRYGNMFHIRRAGAFENRGHCLTSLGKYPEAQRSFREAIALYDRKTMPAHVASGYLGLAEALHTSGKDREAIAHFELALAAVEGLQGSQQVGFARGAAQVFISYIRCRRGARTAMGNLRRAIERLTKEGGLTPEQFIESRLMLAKCLLKHGRFARAERVLANIQTDDDPPDAIGRKGDWQFAMAQSLWGSGRHAQAIDLATKSMERLRVANATYRRVELELHQWLRRRAPRSLERRVSVGDSGSHSTRGRKR